MRQQIDAIDAALLRFQRALFSHAEERLHTLIPGYTHLQRAQPLSYFHLLVEMAGRDRQRRRMAAGQSLPLVRPLWLVRPYRSTANRRLTIGL